MGRQTLPEVHERLGQHGRGGSVRVEPVERAHAVDQRDDHGREVRGRDRDVEAGRGAFSLDDARDVVAYLVETLLDARRVRRLTDRERRELGGGDVERGVRGERLLEPARERGEPELARLGLELVTQPGQVAAALLVEQGEQEIGLVAEVGVEGAAREAGPVGDVLDRGAMEALGGEDLFAGSEQRGTGLGLRFGSTDPNAGLGAIDIHSVLEYRVYMTLYAAGGAQDFMAVRHLVLRGGQGEIGRALAVEVRDSFLQAPSPSDRVLNRARRRWFADNWPEHYARMGGVASAFGVDPLDDDACATELPAVPFQAGCSALWSPPASSADGHGRIGRNFDFMTGSALDAAGLPPDPAQPPMMSRPYVIESYPDDGRASLVVAGADLSGCFEGMNDAGLAVVLFADDESSTLRPALQLQAGVHELQLARFVLDRCSTVEDAIETLYGAKQYDNFITCHYLIGDVHGDAFVWERDTHNREHVVRAGDGPLCVTNYLLHRHESIRTLPDDAPDTNMYARARTLDERATAVPLSAADVRAALRAVRVEGPVPVARTMWSSLYDLDERSLELEFYLGETPDRRQRRSAALTFTLAA
jgi:hypothetical protein